MNRLLSLLAATCLAAQLFAQKQPLSYFLPDGKYDAAVPTPEQFLGFQVGEWHVSPEQIVSYLKEVDRASDRVSMEVYGWSNERRPLVLLTITSAENHANLLKIKALHRSLSDPSQPAPPDFGAIPAVIYQGFSIHGNEASGSNAALLYAYWLAAAEGAEVESFLKNTVVLLDPCFNPDGLNRFSAWVNAGRSRNLVSDPAGREFNEPWPRGRTNHYGFDLNRDWLAATQPESVGRLKTFREWLPNILTDHHEMGSGSTFFFQPGVPSRVNALTPPENQELTRKIGNFHARALDAIGSLYFTEENFDDFYYGKGSTYPDARGSIGILFEQASARGHAQETDGGLLTFPFAIRNQVACAVSTLRAANELRPELNRYQRDFYEKSRLDAAADPVKVIVFGQKTDAARLSHFVEMLLRHGIEVFDLNEKLTTDWLDFEPGRAFAVPLAQPSYRLIHAIFDRQTAFADSVFYDISAWTMPLAFDLDMANLTKIGSFLGKKLEKLPETAGHITGESSSYAWLFGWGGHLAPGFLNRLLSENVQVRVGTRPFSLGGRDWPAGTLVVPVAAQTRGAAELFELLKKRAAEWGVEVVGATTGLTDSGADLGSSNFVVLKKPKVAVLCGDGTEPTSTGAAWYLLDTRWAMPPVMLELANSSFLRNEKFNVAVMPDGSYGSLPAERVREFLMGGGTVVAWGGALKWLKTNGLAQLDFRQVKKQATKNQRPYDKLDVDNQALANPGCILSARLDRTHPLCFGFDKNTLPMFVGDTLFMETGQNPYATPISFAEKPLLAGYLHPTSERAASGAAGAVVCGVGKGKIVCLAGDPNFRAFWLGTERLFANAVFFGQIINNEAAERAKRRE